MLTVYLSQHDLQLWRIVVRRHDGVFGCRRWFRRLDVGRSLVDLVEVFADVASERRLLDERCGAVRTPMPRVARGSVPGVPQPLVPAELAVRQKRPPADVACKRPVVRVPALLVRDAVLRPQEPLAAERAGVRFLACVMAADVLAEVRRLDERHPARVAGVRRLARVQTAVHLQRRRSRKLRPALLADVRPAASVTGAVVQQVLVTRETTTADRADVWSGTGVKEPVCLQRRPAGESLSAVRTRVHAGFSAKYH